MTSMAKGANIAVDSVAVGARRAGVDVRTGCARCRRVGAPAAGQRPGELRRRLHLLQPGPAPQRGRALHRQERVGGHARGLAGPAAGQRRPGRAGRVGRRGDVRAGARPAAADLRSRGGHPAGRVRDEGRGRDRLRDAASSTAGPARGSSAPSGRVTPPGWPASRPTSGSRWRTNRRAAPPPGPS